ncbi:GNAT family N-acetyltransferase [Aquibium oceanicum]|uniref:Ribosomal-protein-alanine acetyltransferase n=1 Tax=Aquibium oceanicum TaxID=1670800 RepID=A0A1L3SME1_9HYPH|nr:GNAT family N-acetyltransferase [Aquibium oceanicum]APH70563.1 ribosomal-protein-alanine acetyltransferase [Aquibium oceanicum]
MRVPFINGRKREFLIDPLATRDTAAMAVLHREDFSRPWTSVEFAGLLAQETVFGFAAREIGRPAALPAGFVLARQAAGEAEILTITVARSFRRGGLGWALMDAVLRELYHQRAEALFLEVDETNHAAVALYRRMRFREVAKRPAYYSQPGVPPTTALVMRRDLR